MEVGNTTLDLLGSTEAFSTLRQDEDFETESMVNSSTEDDLRTPSMTTPQVALTALLTLTFVVSVLGNSAVFLVILNTRSLRRLNNVLIVSLAAVDMLRTLVVVPMFVVTGLVTWPRPLPSALCPIFHALHMSCELVTIYNLTAISIERVFVITRPMVYQRVITRKRIGVCVGILWMTGFTYGFLQILWFQPRNSHQPGIHVLSQSLVSSLEDAETCEFRPSLSYAIFDFIICLGLPLVIMTGCYGKIFCVVQSQINRIVPSLSTVLDQSDITTYHPEHSSRDEALRRHSHDSIRSYRSRSARFTFSNHDSGITSTLGCVVEAKGEEKLDTEYTGARVERLTSDTPCRARGVSVEEMQRSLERSLSEILDPTEDASTPGQHEHKDRQLQNDADIPTTSATGKKKVSTSQTDQESPTHYDQQKVSTASKGSQGSGKKSVKTAEEVRDEKCLQIRTADSHSEVIIRVDHLATADRNTPKTQSQVPSCSSVAETPRSRTPTLAWDSVDPNSLLSPEEKQKSTRSHSNPEVKPLSKHQCSVLHLHPVLKRGGPERLKDFYLQTKRGSVTFNLADEGQGESKECDMQHQTQQRSASHGLPGLRVVTMDDDTNFSSDANTTDTSLSGSGLGHSPHYLSRMRRHSSTHSLHRRTSLPSSAPLSNSSRFNSASLTSLASSGKSRSIFRLSENKAIKMMIIVVGAFMLCWMPYNICFLMKMVDPDHMGQVTWDVVSALVFLSAAANPFIYNFYSSEFRRALRRIATCKDKTNIPWA